MKQAPERNDTGLGILHFTCAVHVLVWMEWKTLSTSVDKELFITKTQFQTELQYKSYIVINGHSKRA